MHYFTMNYKELCPAPVLAVAGCRNICPDFRLRSEINLKIIEIDRFVKFKKIKRPRHDSYSYYVFSDSFWPMVPAVILQSETTYCHSDINFI